jgi:hypothetical protein
LRIDRIDLFTQWFELVVGRHSYANNLLFE